MNSPDSYFPELHALAQIVGRLVRTHTHWTSSPSQEQTIEELETLINDLLIPDPITEPLDKKVTTDE